MNKERYKLDDLIRDQLFLPGVIDKPSYKARELGLISYQGPDGERYEIWREIKTRSGGTITGTVYIWLNVNQIPEQLLSN